VNPRNRQTPSERVMHRASFLAARRSATHPGFRGPAGRSAVSGGAHGVHRTLRSIAPARQALDRSPIRLTHLPFSECRPDDFVGGSAVHSHGSDLCHPLCLERQPIADTRCGFWVSDASRAIRSGSVSLDRSGRDCLGLRPLSGVRHAAHGAARVVSKTIRAVSRRKSASGSYPLVSLGS